MKWIKIDRDKNGFMTEECLDKIIEQCPIVLWHTKMGGGFDVFAPQNKVTKEFFREKLRVQTAYTHYLPIPKLEV